MLSWMNTREDLASNRDKIVVIGIGSIEQHGDHLPVGTDFSIAQEVSKRIAEKLDGILFPTIPYSTCIEHKGYAGTINILPHTFSEYIKDICAAIYREGFRKIALVSCHGGNWIIRPTVREINFTHEDISVMYNVYSGKNQKVILENQEADLHAGESETSKMLFLHPEYVKMEKAKDCIPEATQEYMDYLVMEKLTEGTGIWGKATLGSADKGERLLEDQVDSITSYINEVFSYIDSKVSLT